MCKLVSMQIYLTSLMHSQGIQYGSSLGAWGSMYGRMVNLQSRQHNRQNTQKAMTFNGCSAPAPNSPLWRLCNP